MKHQIATKMKTKNAINELMIKLQDWSMLDNLTESEKESILTDLKSIAGTAVMEAHNKMQNIMPDFYNEINK